MAKLITPKVVCGYYTGSMGSKFEMWIEWNIGDHFKIRQEQGVLCKYIQFKVSVTTRISTWQRHTTSTRRYPRGKTIRFRRLRRPSGPLSPKTHCALSVDCKLSVALMVRSSTLEESCRGCYVFQDHAHAFVFVGFSPPGTWL